MFERYDMVNASDCGSEPNLSIIGTFNKIEDSLCLLLKSFNLDGLTLSQKYNATWVFSKNKTKFLKEFAWNEQIAIKCFFSKKSLVRAIVDIVLFNKNNEICVYSQIEICALDLSTKRIRKIEEFGFNEIPIQNSFIDMGFEKIISEKCCEIAKRKVALTNIDYNQHTNNIEYLRFLLDTYKVEEFNTKQIQTIQIDYINQSVINDELSIYKEIVNNEEVFIIKNKDKEIAKVKIVYLTNNV